MELETTDAAAVLVGMPEFVVLAADSPSSARESVISRLQNELRERNAFDGFPYTLSFSVGVAHFDPAAPPTIETLLATADAMLLEQKKNRRADVALVEVAGR